MNVSELKFGDTVVNEWASEDNPTHNGIVVRVDRHFVACTNGKGEFWEVFIDGNKLRKTGSVLAAETNH